MKRLLIIVLITAFASCTHGNKSKKINVIDIASNVGKTEIVSLSEIAESVYIIPLETNSNSLLGSPYNYLSFENGVIFIKQNINELKKFDQNGNFLYTFNRHGRGPEEYEHLSSFKIDSKSNNILVSTHSGLIEYDQNANFIKKINVLENPIFKNNTPELFFKIHGDLYVFSFSRAKGENCAIVTDNSLNPKYYIKYPQRETDALKNLSRVVPIFNPYFYIYKDTLRVFNGYDENILSVSNHNRLDTCFTLKYGKYDYRNSINISSGGDLPYLRRYTDVFESSLYLFIKIHFGSLPHKNCKMLKGGKAGRDGETVENPITCSIFNKATGEFKYIDQPEFNELGFVDDINGGPAIWPDYISAKDYLVDIIEAHKFIQHAQSHKVSDKFKKIADGLNENSNPVVVLVKLKSSPL